MLFKYTKLPSKDKTYTYYLRPLINVRLFRGQASVPLVAHLDTGADQTLIHTDIADGLYIDWKSGIKTSVYGIEGKESFAYIKSVEIEICDIPNSKIQTQVAFTSLKNISVLFGQYGFFEHFKVLFDAKNELFEINK